MELHAFPLCLDLLLCLLLHETHLVLELGGVSLEILKAGYRVRVHGDAVAQVGLLGLVVLLR